MIFDTVTQDNFIFGCQSLAQPTESLISPLGQQDRPLQACNALLESNTKEAADFSTSSLLYFQALTTVTKISDQQNSSRYNPPTEE